MSVQYLEALDSVRQPWHDGRRTTAQRLDQIHADMTAVASLAVGRAIVLPEPFALDSWVGMELVNKVAAARASNSTHSLIEFHTIRKRSLEEALDVNLRRAADHADPYVSSMFPDEPLRYLSPGEPSLNSDRRAQLLRAVLGEYRQVGRPWPAKPILSAPSLADLLVAFAAGEQEPDGTGDLAHTERSLRRTIRKLATAHSGEIDTLPLNARSWLRTNLPWPNDQDGRSASEIVRATELAELIEFLDTAYNLKVASSMGQVPFTASTDLVKDKAVGRAREIAQRVAIEKFGHSRILGAIGTQGAAFEVTVSGAVVDKSLTERQLTAAEHAVNQALEGVVKLWDEDDFWESVRAIRAADDRETAEGALQSHRKFISQKLRATTRPTAKPWHAISGALIGVVAGAAADKTIELSAQLPVLNSEPFSLLITLGGAAAGAAAVAAHEGRRVQSQVATITSAVGGMLEIE
jgi:hypothetical protein